MSSRCWCNVYLLAVADMMNGWIEVWPWTLSTVHAIYYYLFIVIYRTVKHVFNSTFLLLMLLFVVHAF